MGRQPPARDGSHSDSDLDWAAVRLECHTGQAYSRWTRPSLFQKSVNLTSLTPRAPSRVEKKQKALFWKVASLAYFFVLQGP